LILCKALVKEFFAFLANRSNGEYALTGSRSDSSSTGSNMTDDTQKKDSGGGASPETKRWIAWREGARADAAADREKALHARLEKEHRIEDEYHNPLAVYFGFLVVLLLLIGGWFIIDWMRCDPFYSDLAMTHRSCR
jgi:hypothetical protein